MASLIGEIPSMEIFLIVIMLICGSVGLQAYLHKQDLAMEDVKAVLHWVFYGLIGLAILEALLQVLRLVTI